MNTITNARDLGGYQTRDGKTVRKSVLFRSAAFTDVSPETLDSLVRQYNLAAIIDLRATYEREEDPEPIQKGAAQYHFRIMDEQLMASRAAAVSDVLMEPNVNPIKRIAAMLDARLISDQMYVEFLTGETGKTGFRNFFRVLLETPEGRGVLWHCTSGKDRTGVAAMLLLGVLNVEESSIMDDFLQTNVSFEKEIRNMRQKFECYALDEALMDGLLVVGKGVLASYMYNAIQYIKKNYGDIPGYVRKELGLTDADIEQLQSLYLG